MEKLTLLGNTRIRVHLLEDAIDVRAVVDAKKACKRSLRGEFVLRRIELSARQETQQKKATHLYDSVRFLFFFFPPVAFLAGAALLGAAFVGAGVFAMVASLLLLMVRGIVRSAVVNEGSFEL